MSQLISDIVSGPLVAFANDKISSAISSSNHTCATSADTIVPVISPGMINFGHDNPVVKVLDYILNDVVGVNGTLGLNVLANNVTNNTGNSLVF